MALDLDVVGRRVDELLSLIRGVRENRARNKGYPGYRMTDRSKRAWDEIEANSRRIEREAEENAIKAKEISALVGKIRDLIFKCRKSYKDAVDRYAHKDMKIYSQITLDWSPERVLSVHRDFPSVCAFLSNESVWNVVRRLLNRQEIYFIIKAYEYYQERK